MRTRVLAALLGAFCLLRVPQAAGPPKLAVLIVVDQMRADYVERFQDEWSAGLKRLVTRGAWFRRAAYPYLETLTCAGHATIGTGAYPATHGIFQNTWFDRGSGRLMVCTQDSTATAIGYGRTVSGNDGPANLRTPTFADEMRRQKGARVVSLSLKARSAIMLAGHAGDAVTWLSESLDAWETSSAYAKAPVPQVAQYVGQHPIEADFGKTWSLSLEPSRYRAKDDAVGEAPPSGWTATFPHLLGGTPGATAADAAYFAQWERSPFADAYVGRMAAALVDSMGLGRGAETDVLAVSFSSPDLVGHAFGPKSREVQDMYAQLDRTLGGLLDALDRIVGPDQYVLALSADHGVSEIPEQAMSEGRDGGRLDSGAMATVVEQVAQQALGPGRTVSRVVGSDLYFQPGVFEKLSAKRGALSSIIKAIEQRPGVARAFHAVDLAKGKSSSDGLLRAAALSWVEGRSGDIVVAAKAGWMIGSTGTTHGSANPDDQRVPVMLYGAGVRPGRYNDAATPADIAPTLAAIVGISLPHAEGKPLSAALAITSANSSTAGR